MKSYLIEASGDGQRQSVALFNVTMEAVKRKLMELSWHGTYEEAIQDECMKATVDSLEDEDNWNCGVWYENGEQCWTRISTIDEIEGLADFDEKAFRREWGIRGAGMAMISDAMHGARCFHHWFIRPLLDSTVEPKEETCTSNHTKMP